MAQVKRRGTIPESTSTSLTDTVASGLRETSFDPLAAEAKTPLLAGAEGAGSAGAPRVPADFKRRKMNL